MSDQLLLTEEWALPSRPTRWCVFSANERYRYTLEQELDVAHSAGTIVWIGLNPSTATEMRDDPTIRRELDFSRRWGYGTYIKLNLFALRSPDPKALYESDDAIGPENDHHILRNIARSNTVVCCWGTHGAYLNRGSDVRAMLSDYQLHILGLNQDGSPTHPLYLKKETALRPWL